MGSNNNSNDQKEVLNAALPFQAGLASVETRLERYASSFNRRDRSFDIDSNQGTSSFMARSVATRVGPTLVYSAAHTGLTYSSSVDEPFAVFLLPFLGRASFRVERRWYQLAAGQSAVYMAGQARRCETELVGGTLIQLSRERLAAKAAELSGDASASGRYLETFERPWEFSEAVPLQRQLLAVMRRTLGLIDLVQDGSRLLADSLRIDDLLYRSVVMLARPELLKPF